MAHAAQTAIMAPVPHVGRYLLFTLSYAALQAALVGNGGPGVQGSSFVAVQPWVHDFSAFESMESKTQDNLMGRRRSDNAERDEGVVDGLFQMSRPIRGAFFWCPPLRQGQLDVPAVGL